MWEIDLEQAKAFRKAVITAIPELIRIDGANTAQACFNHKWRNLSVKTYQCIGCVGSIFAGDHENVLFNNFNLHQSYNIKWLFFLFFLS